MQSRGGWGGSAHYPDPTAQSALLAAPRPQTAGAHGGAPSGPSQPASASQICSKNAKFLLFSVVVESCALERGERGGGASIGCADVSHGQGPLRSPCPCPMAEVLTDSIGGGPSLAGQGLACSARHFRTLPVTPVVTRVWLSQTADSFPQPHGPAQTSVFALREDLFRRARTTHWAKGRPTGTRR